MARRTFRPGLFTTLIAALVMTVLLNLGFWQIRRAHGAQELLQSFARGRRAAPRSIHSLGQIAARRKAHSGGPIYVRVKLTGHYDARRQMLLDNQVNNHHLGYNVYTPFELRAGGYVIVDRGWVPMYARRNLLPNIPVSPRPRTVTGMLTRFPQPGLKVAPESSTHGWPRVVEYPDASQVGRILNARVAPLLLRLDPDQPDGYVRDWKPHIMSPQQHYGYAFQWFALGAALVVVWVWVNLKPVNDDESSDQDTDDAG